MRRLAIDFGTTNSVIATWDEHANQSRCLHLERLSVHEADQHRATVIAKAGRNLGGSDVDQWLVTYVLEQLCLSIDELGNNYTRLLTLCEQAKIALSSVEATDIEFGQHSVRLTRDELNMILRNNGFFTALRRVIDKVMITARQQGVFREDIHYVLMRGADYWSRLATCKPNSIYCMTTSSRLCAREETMNTGREPRLSTSYRKGGLWKISPRRLATMLNTLPPHRISLPAAAAALHHSDFGVRYNAARTLSHRGDRDARLIMQETLNDGTPQTRASVARHLYGFSWFSALPLLMQALDDDDARVREAAIYTLCDFTEPQAYQVLVEALGDEPDDDVRLAGAVGLRDRQDPDAVPVLQQVLLAHDPDVRIKALEALGANHTPAAVPVVETTMNHDPHIEVVYAATLSLVELRELSALPTIIETIQGNRGARQAAIIRGWFHASGYMQLELLNNPAIGLLVDALDEALADPLAREAAIWPLAWIRHPRCMQSLSTAYYDSKDAPYKAHIVRVAWALMSDIRQELLADALGNPVLRQAVEELAARQGHFVEFDTEATTGSGMRNPVLGR